MYKYDSNEHTFITDNKIAIAILEAHCECKPYLWRYLFGRRWTKNGTRKYLIPNPERAEQLNHFISKALEETELDQ